MSVEIEVERNHGMGRWSRKCTFVHTRKTHKFGDVKMGSSVGNGDHEKGVKKWKSGGHESGESGVFWVALIGPVWSRGHPLFLCILMCHFGNTSRRPGGEIVVCKMKERLWEGVV